MQACFAGGRGGGGELAMGRGCSYLDFGEFFSLLGVTL